MSQIQQLLKVDLEDRAKVREVYGKTEESMRGDLEILKGWMKKQPHFPVFDNDIKLENILIRNKCQIERTKIKLDKYFSLRGIYPEFFTKYKPGCDEFTRARRANTFVPLPKLTNKQERVLFYKINDEDPSYFDCFGLMALILCNEEVMAQYDYFVGTVVVKDWAGFRMSHLKKMDVAAMTKMMKLLQGAYSARILSFEYINCPPFMYVILELFKPIFKEKLFNRIHLHKDLESLYKNVPKECLPKEYGGDQPELKDLHERWTQELALQGQFLEETANLVSDETLRVGPLPYDSELYGTDGTFKTLNLD